MANRILIALYMDNTLTTVIKSKLRPPVLGRDTLTRPPLLHRLDAHRPLTLIVAPAGYGKTTLMVAWLAHARSPYAWLALDAYDNSLTAFTTYLLAALETVFPNAFPETQALLNSGANLSPVAMAQTLVNELEALPHSVPLVLDDYHCIQDPAIQQLMAELLRYQPHTLELVLLTRHDPPLRLSELRMRNLITELRAQQLSFSPEESGAFLKSTGLPLDGEQVAGWTKMTEGWPAGLRMVTLLLHQQGGGKALASLEASDSFAAKYLLDEVFTNMPPALQMFLLQTTHMEQVCADLCATVSGGAMTAAQCQANLERLTQQNLFVFALDGKNAWYRYHHLFRTVLQHRAEQALPADEMAALHRRASGWLAANGQLDAAIAHAVKAGDVQAVVDLVRSHRRTLLNMDNWAALETWRALLPRRMLEQHPQLLILEAWLLSRRALFAEISRCVAAVDALIAATPMLEEERSQLCSELDVIRVQPLYWSGDLAGCIAAGRRALQGVPLDAAFIRHVTRVFYAGALEMVDPAEADQVMAAGLHEAKVYGDGHRQVREQLPMGLLYWTRADMVRMEECGSQALALAQECGALEFVAWGRYLRACARYQQNDFTHVAQDLTAVLELPFIARPFVYSQSFFALAALHQAQGHPDQALQYARQGVAFAEESGNPVMVERARSFLAHLCFRQGSVQEALRWVAEPHRIPPTMPMPTLHVAPLVRAALLLGLSATGAATGIAASAGAEMRAEADELLKQLRTELERQHNTRFLIEVLALQAWSLAYSGDTEGALDLLERSVLLTIPGQAIRALADLDYLIGPLLVQLTARGRIRSQVARIRRAAAHSPLVNHEARPGPPAAAPANGACHPDLPEPLTFREMDVLLLLQERPSNKEIAQQLNITTETVKRHLTNIYQKLQVENQREAIARARAMHLLPAR